MHPPTLAVALISKESQVVLLATPTAEAAQVFHQLLYIVIAGSAIAVVGLLVHRHLKKRWSESDPTQAFSLADLRRLHDQGRLSDDEYQRARGAVVAEGLAVLHPDTATPAQDPDTPAQNPHGVPNDPPAHDPPPPDPDGPVR